MEEYVLICEDSMEGILSGIYEAYQYKKEMGIEHHESIHLAVKEPVTQRFFTQYKPIQTDHEKAAKVTDTIVRQLGNDTWYRISISNSFRALQSCKTVYSMQKSMQSIMSCHF